MRINTYLSGVEGNGGEIAKLDLLHAKLEESDFRKQLVDDFLQWLQPEEILPREYASFRPLVSDGISFFLIHISPSRLSQFMHSLLELSTPPTRDKGILLLCRFFPTLQKLAQILARNNNLEQGFRNILTQLEQQRLNDSSAAVAHYIYENIPEKFQRAILNIHPTLLSCASVAVTLRFQILQQKGTKELPQEAVFKILKPGINEQLQEELIVFAEMADYFENNCSRYPLKQLRFKKILRDIRSSLKNETNLGQEKKYLKEAREVYTHKDIIVPQQFSLQSKECISMEYVEGSSLSCVSLTTEQKKGSAALLFEQLICKPLFSQKELVLFHGDPHGGNIIFKTSADSSQVIHGIIDWSLAGHLSRNLRRSVIQLAVHLRLNNQEAASHCILGLLKEPVMCRLEEMVSRVTEILTSPSKVIEETSLLRKCFLLLEELSYQGFLFEKDLLLFRKSFFTLEGILLELDPDFNFDRVLLNSMQNLLVAELPLRQIYFHFPLLENRNSYTSGISNGELFSLFYHSLSEFSLPLVQQLNSIHNSLLKTLYPSPR